ncbi:MAG: rhodanese-like domain-containing protein [Planctomycetota bacterium]
MVRSLGMVCWGLIALIAETHLTTAVAAEASLRDELPKNWSWSLETQGPMCGVYAVCRALTMLGTTVEPSELWKAEFVGSSKGSTPDELIAAVRAHGGEASLRSGLTFPEICSLGIPVIANVRHLPEDKEFNHWVCVQASQQGLLVYDGPNSGKFMNPSEFLALWSGIGIIVSKGKLAVLQLYLVRLSGMGSLMILTYLLLRWGRRTDELKQSSIFALQRLGLATLASFVLGSLIYGIGSGHFYAVALAAAPYRLPNIKSGSLNDVLEALQRPASLVIDARMERDYARGTIGNAVNIPVHASFQEIKTFLKDIPKSVRIVVFCQSKTCEYDEAVAKMLAQAGFSDVTVSDLGYAEYRQSLNARHESPIPGG